MHIPFYKLPFFTTSLHSSTMPIHSCPESPPSNMPPPDLSKPPVPHRRGDRRDSVHHTPGEAQNNIQTRYMPGVFEHDHQARGKKKGNRNPSTPAHSVSCYPLPSGTPQIRQKYIAKCSHRYVEESRVAQGQRPTTEAAAEARYCANATLQRV